MSTALQVIDGVPVITVDATTPPHIGEQLTITGGHELTSWDLQATIDHQGAPLLGAAQAVLVLQAGTAILGQAVITDWTPVVTSPGGLVEIRAVSDGPLTPVQTRSGAES